MAAYPAVQLLEDSFCSRKTEVIDPTPKLRGQCSNGGPDGAFDWDPNRTILPKTGEIIADLIAGVAPNTDLSAFDARRF